MTDQRLRAAERAVQANCPGAKELLRAERRRAGLCTKCGRLRDKPTGLLEAILKLERMLIKKHVAAGGEPTALCNLCGNALAIEAVRLATKAASK